MRIKDKSTKIVDAKAISVTIKGDNWLSDALKDLGYKDNPTIVFEDIEEARILAKKIRNLIGNY